MDNIVKLTGPQEKTGLSISAAYRGPAGRQGCEKELKDLEEKRVSAYPGIIVNHAPGLGRGTAKE